MTLPATPPKYDSWSDIVKPIKAGESGWRVWALQRALIAVGRDSVVDDGLFEAGRGTERAVKGFQANNGLFVDGIAGPKTQTALLQKIEHRVHDKFPQLPEGLLRGFAVAEGGGVLAATNWYTPPGGVPGVDCGPVQWRIYGPPFDQEELRAAFDPKSAFEYAAQTLVDRMINYNKRRPSLIGDILLRTALIAHNAPFMAEQMVRNGRLSTPNALATWTVKPEGGSYTHQEWFWEYTNRLLQYT